MARKKGKPARHVPVRATVVQRRWRDYQTAAGGRPVKKALHGLPNEHVAEIVAAMAHVRRTGLEAARHVRGEIYEVRVDVEGLAYRLLFATEGERGQVLLSLELFFKKTQQTPERLIKLAERRLRDWRSRSRAAGASRKTARGKRPRKRHR